MGAANLAIRRGLYGKLSGDTTLNALLNTPPAGYSKNIFYEVAPSSARFDYVIFTRQASTPTYAMTARAFDSDVWLVKGVGRADTADNIDAIAARLDQLLTDATLTISGRDHLYLRRESDVDYAEVTDGTTYRHAGSLFRLITA